MMMTLTSLLAFSVRTDVTAAVQRMKMTKRTEKNQGLRTLIQILMHLQDGMLKRKKKLTVDLLMLQKRVEVADQDLGPHQRGGGGNHLIAVATHAHVPDHEIGTGKIGRKGLTVQDQKTGVEGQDPGTGNIDDAEITSAVEAEVGIDIDETVKETAEAEAKTEEEIAAEIAVEVERGVAETGAVVVEIEVMKVDEKEAEVKAPVQRM